MADFEDSNTPTWSNQIEGQANLMDAVRRQITYSDPASGKNYKLNERTAVLLGPPAWLASDEKHVLVDGTPMSGALFDFGLYLLSQRQRTAGAAPGRTFTCRRSKATWKRVCGTIFFCTRKTRAE